MPTTRATTRANAKRTRSPSEDGHISTDAHSPKRRRRTSSSRLTDTPMPDDSPKFPTPGLTDSPTSSGYVDSPMPRNSEDSDQPDRIAKSIASANPSIYAIGHSTLPLLALTQLLHSVRVSHLVDVRAFPKSHTNPQFNRDALEESDDLEKMGITYTWLGIDLGGCRKYMDGVERHKSLLVPQLKNYAAHMTTTSFKRGLEELKEMARQARQEGKRVVIMCSEAVFWRCHRRLIADRLTADGWVVKHLGLRAKEATKHNMWNIARVDNEGELVYDCPGRVH